MDLDAMTYIRAAIANALVEDMTIKDLWAMAEYAPTPQSFDAAVNTLAQTITQNNVRRTP